MRKLLILICLFISAQLSAQVYQIMPQYGYQTARMRMDSVLLVPADTIRNKSGVVRIGTQLYAGNGSYWTVAGNGGGGADSSVFFTKFRSDTMRANVYNAIANVPTPTLQDAYNISGYPQIVYDASKNFAIKHSDNTDGLYFNNSTKDILLGDSAKVVSYLNINTGADITINSSSELILNPDSAQTGYVWTAKNANGHGEWRAASSGTIPTLQQSYNVSSYPQIDFGNPINNGRFSIYSSYIDNNKSGLFMDESAKSFLLGDSAKVLSYLEVNTGDNITLNTPGEIILNPDSSQTGYVWTAKNNTGHGEWRPSAAADSSVYFTNFRADTMRSNLYANKVPYTGATQDVDLGAHKLGVQAINVNGTNGNGNIHFKHQANDATASGQSTSLFADSNGDLKWKNDGEPYVTLQTNHISLDRTYRFPDSTGTIALLSNLTSKANLAGPTFTDSLVLTSTVGGISLPNMTQTQMNAITPRLGTQIYNTTYDAVCTYTNDFGWWSNEQPWVSSNGFMVFDEFITYAYNSNQNGNFFQIQNASGTWTSATPLGNRPGILTMSTSTSATGRLTVQADGIALASNIVGGGKLIYEADVQIPTLSSAAQTFHFFTGFSSTNTNVSTNSIAFLYDSAGTNAGSAAIGRWQVVCANGSTRSYTTTDSTVTAGRWYRLRAEVNAAGNSVAFYINGALVKTETNNIPTGAVTPVTSIIKTVGTTARTAWLDFIRIRQKFTTPR